MIEVGLCQNGEAMPSASGSADLPPFSCSLAVPIRYLMLVAGQIRDTVDSRFLCSGNPGAADGRNQWTLMSQFAVQEHGSNGVAIVCIVDAGESN
jgi:hypothetical protein